ncbi:ROK family protein, partial [Salmonella enterica]|uniref:ROK family protein n=1 Tax=Salmonella enterica TaxID=28901 RepID=UPI0020C496F3
AIENGGKKLPAELIDNNNRISQPRELPTPSSKTPDALREALKALVEPLRSEARQVSIASTGIIQEGILLSLNPHNLGG